MLRIPGLKSGCGRSRWPWLSPRAVYLDQRILAQNHLLMAAISRNLPPIESAICEQRGEQDFGQPASAGPNWPQITSFRDRRFLAFLDSFRPATIQ